MVLIMDLPVANDIVDIVNGANDLMYLKTKQKQCEICYTTSTPAWRRANGYNILCNRCGLREKNIKQKN